MKAKKVVVHLAEEADDYSVEDVVLAGPWRAHIMLEDGSTQKGVAYVALNDEDVEIDEEGRWHFIASYENFANLVVVSETGDTVVEAERVIIIYP